MILCSENKTGRDAQSGLNGFISFISFFQLFQTGIFHPLLKPVTTL